MKRKPLLVLASVVFITVATVGTVSASKETDPLVTVTETPGPENQGPYVKQKKLEKEKEKELKKQEKMEKKNLKKAKGKEITILDRKDSTKTKTSMAVVAVGEEKQNTELVKQFDQKRIKVLEWTNAIEAEGQTVYTGLKSNRKLSNERNLELLNKLTNQIIEKKFKGKKTETHLDTVIIIGSTNNINTLEKDVNQ